MPSGSLGQPALCRKPPTTSSGRIACIASSVEGFYRVLLVAVEDLFDEHLHLPVVE